MPLISLPYIFSSGTTIIASQTNSNNTTFLNLLNGGLDNTNLTGTAGITGANLDLSSPGAIGGTMPSAGAFSTLKVGTTHQGDILYDNGTSLVRLTPGTSGQFLQTQGAAANPQWASSFVSGMILMWSGTIATIPTGWVLCNGSNSTPDLRNQFIVCADADVSGVAKSTISGGAAQSGGSITASGTTSGPSATQNYGGSAGAGPSVTHTHTFSATVLNPYFALAYIMKT